MPDIPNTIALSSPADASTILASDRRNDATTLQTAVNALIAALSGGASGKALIATDTDTVSYVYPPGHEPVAALTVDALTDNSTTGADTDLATFAAGTFEATKYYLEFSCPNLRQTTAGDLTVFTFKEGASTVTSAQIDAPVGTGVAGVCVFFRLPFTPTAAAHTYKVTWQPSAGTVVLTNAAQIRIVKA